MMNVFWAIMLLGEVSIFLPLKSPLHEVKEIGWVSMAGERRGDEGGNAWVSSRLG